MRVVIQRVTSASVTIGGIQTARIGRGLVVLLGIAAGDTDEDGAWLAGKIARLRIFPNAAGKMDLAVTQLGEAVSSDAAQGDDPDDVLKPGDVLVPESVLVPSNQPTPGGVLVVSQFTLLAATAAGNRPSFTRAALPAVARPLYETFLRQCAEALGRPVACGEFGADMQVALTNDGPVTILIDSRQRE
jgi:D-tyrosyl-tRNA(Tyr) deacylase